MIEVSKEDKHHDDYSQPKPPTPIPEDVNMDKTADVDPGVTAKSVPLKVPMTKEDQDLIDYMERIQMGAIEGTIVGLTKKLITCPDL